MNQKNNNTNKGTQIEIYPEDFRKCFFVVKTEISELEMTFLTNQLKRRTNFKIKDEESIYALSNKFIDWFLKAILPDLSDFGIVLSDTIRNKVQNKIEWAAKQ